VAPVAELVLPSPPGIVGARPMLIVPAWIEAHDVVPDGFRKGAPFRLYDYQLQFLVNFYLVRGNAAWYPDNPVKAPAFVYRRAMLVAPQKIGKNPLIAAQCTAEFVGPVLFRGFAGIDDGYACADWGCGCGWEYAYEPGEPMGMAWPTPKIQVTAFSEDSTENTYDALRPMISQGPLANVLPKAGEDFIRHPSGAEDSRIDTVTSSNQSRLGARTTFVPQDELGLWTPEAKMVKLADTQYRNLSGMGGRAALTSNAWDPAERSVARREAELVEKGRVADVYIQFVRPPKNLSYSSKAERRKIHLSVYFPDTRRENGGHVELESIEAEAAGMAEHDPAQAARFYGNMLIPGAGVAVDPEVWDSLARPFRVVEPGTPIGIGFDGSISRDATFMRGCTRDGFTFILGKWIRPTGSAMQAWRDAHPGQDWQVPRGEVHQTLARAFETYRVGKMYADPPHWRTEIEDWQAIYGEEVVLALDTNQATRMVPAVDRWRTAITAAVDAMIVEGNAVRISDVPVVQEPAAGEADAEGADEAGPLERVLLHTHDGDPETAEHVKAMHLKKVHLADPDSDERTRYVLIKGPENRQIDGGIADVLALEAAATMPEVLEDPEPFIVFGRSR
jgi:hypothetical protein